MSSRVNGSTVMFKRNRCSIIFFTGNIFINDYKYLIVVDKLRHI